MKKKNPIVTITLEDGGVIRAELYPDEYGPQFHQPREKGLL